MLTQSNFAKLQRLRETEQHMQHLTLRQAGHRALQLMLLAALLLPAIVPSGYMVKRNESTNVVELTVCPGVAHHQSQLNTRSAKLEFDAANPDMGTTSRIDEPAPCPLAISTLAALPDINLTQVLPVHSDNRVTPLVHHSYQTFQVLPPVRAPPFTS